MGLYSRNRGKRGERLWCSFCREQGYDVHRTAQYRGNTGAAGDVEGLPFIHLYMDGLQEGKVSGDNIAVALKDEIGLDVYAEFAKADKETQEAKKCKNTAS